MPDDGGEYIRMQQKSLVFSATDFRLSTDARNCLPAKENLGA